MTKFELADDKRATGCRDDNPGVVVVRVFLASTAQRPVTGNISRSIRLKDVRVSEVHEALLKFLTGD